jgi:hypothetical protein
MSGTRTSRTKSNSPLVTATYSTPGNRLILFRVVGHDPCSTLIRIMARKPRITPLPLAGHNGRRRSLGRYLRGLPPPPLPPPGIAAHMLNDCFFRRRLLLWPHRSHRPGSSCPRITLVPATRRTARGGLRSPKSAPPIAAATRFRTSLHHRGGRGLAGRVR